MSGPARTICVVGESDRQLVTVVRSLGRSGARVALAWEPDESPVRRSRYVTGYDGTPPRPDRAAGWEGAFADFVRRHRFSLVMAADEVAMVALAAVCRRATLEGLVAIGDPERFDACVDRARMYALAAAHGIPVPEHRMVAAAERASIEVRGPVLLESRLVRDPAALRRRRRARAVAGPADLAAALAHFEPTEELLVAAQPSGDDVRVDLVACAGTVVAGVQLRMPTGAQPVTEPLDARLGAAIARLAAATEYTGPASARFRLEGSSGAWTFLEFTPGFAPTVSTCVAAGADLPRWLVDALVEGRREFPGGYRAGVRDPGERVAIPCARDDPRPKLEVVRRKAARARARVSRAMDALVATMPGVARRRSRRARHALTSARDVLFVCKGNICRSPLAAAYARTWLPGRRVHSAGYHPRGDRPCPGNAVAAAGELGIDLAAHRSRVLEAAMIRDADVVFVFDDENVTTVLARHPGVRGKLHRLSALVPGSGREVRDPYGGSLDEFRRTYAAIRAALDAALAER